MRKIAVKEFRDAEHMLQVPEGQEYFIVVCMKDVTELNACIRENEEQRLIAGLVYIDNYDEVMESV